MSNMKSQPLLVEWFGVVFEGDSKNDVIFLKEVIQKTGLNNDMLNPQTESVNIEFMEKLLSYLRGIFGIFGLCTDDFLFDLSICFFSSFLTLSSCFM